LPFVINYIPNLIDQQEAASYIDVIVYGRLLQLLLGISMRRREFIITGSLLGLAGALDGQAILASPPASHHPMGLQLFTVMVPLERDFEGTLQAVAKIGYKEVETIGSFGRDPARVRELLDRYGLRSPSQHLVPGDLYEVFNAFTQRRMSREEIQRRWLEVMSVDRVTPIIEEGISRAKILGQKYLVWQIIWPEQMASRDLMEQFCRAMDTAGKICANSGLVFNYHNHSEEFKPVNGYVPYDLIVEQTDPKTVKLEMDVYWAVAAKADPIAYFNRHPGRYRQCHLKDGTADGELTAAGAGIVNFPDVLLAARRAGIEHYYIEYDRADDPMAATRQSYDYLKRFF
jgi:sugar phosphate isomerase/epimerase